MTHSKGDPIVLALLGIIGGIVMFVFGFKQRKRYKIIEATPTSKVRSLAVGLVELQGQAEIEAAAMKSPFSQCDCVYYSYLIEQRKKSGKRTTWVTVAKGQSESPFRLKDSTGSILILPKGAQCSFAVDQEYRTQLFSSAREDLFKSGLDRIGFNYQGFFGEKPLRCYETYILPGDALFVLGTATRKKIIQDSEVNQDNLYITSGSEGFFMIADHSEKEILKSLRWQIYAMIYGGPVLTVAGLYYVLFRLGF